MRHNDGRFASYASIEVKDQNIFGSHQMKLVVSCYGTLGEVPFGPTAIADFNDGYAYQHLVENVELYLRGAAHTLTHESEVEAHVEVLIHEGFQLLHGGGIVGNPLSKMIG